LVPTPDPKDGPVRRTPRPAALLLAAGLALTAGACASPDDWSSPRPAPTAVGSLGPGFIGADASPAPAATISPSPGSWDDVRPPEGYRVVLLAEGDGPETTTVADAVTRWAHEHDVSLKTVTVADREHQVDGIVEAMELGPDLVVTAGPDLVDALALVTAHHLDRQFLVLGAQLPEPTDNVTAAVWPGADTRGSEVAGETPDPTAFSREQADAAVRAGVASVLSGLRGVVVAV
jgi:hypothetical protein